MEKFAGDSASVRSVDYQVLVVLVCQQHRNCMENCTQWKAAVNEKFRDAVESLDVTITGPSAR